jgi:hypothetical protein
MLLFVVARSRLDRYGELRQQFENWREGDRRTSQPTFAGVNRRRMERRPVDIGIDSYVKLGWSVTDTEERGS